MRPMPNPMNQATKRNEPHLRLANCFRTVTHSGISRVVCANIFVCRRRIKYYYLNTSSWVYMEHVYCSGLKAAIHQERGPEKRNDICTKICRCVCRHTCMQFPFGNHAFHSNGSKEMHALYLLPTNKNTVAVVITCYLHARRDMIETFLQLVRTCHL